MTGSSATIRVERTPRLSVWRSRGREEAKWWSTTRMGKRIDARPAVVGSAACLDERAMPDLTPLAVTILHKLGKDEA